MSNKTMEEARQNEQLQTYCPLTGVRVLESGSKQFSVSGVSVTWWHCPACNGWHVLTTKLTQVKDGSGMEPSYQASAF